MGIWRIGTDELASSRFTVSALAETVAALSMLSGGPAPPGLREWARTHRPSYRERVAEDPVAADAVRAALRPRWISGLITMPPQREDRTFHDELRRVRRTPTAQARRELAVAGPLPRTLRAPDLVTRVADLLEWVWTHTLRPDWPRRRRILEADIVSRTHRLSVGGWAAAIDGMRHGMRWLGDGRLRINAYDNPPRDLFGAELMFIPCFTARGWVTWSESHRYAIVYPCGGILADAAQTPPSALSRLIGPVRAAILAELAQPRSTSQLVALTGYGLGSVGGHLRVLLDAQVVQRRRAGRSVLYYRTSLGDGLSGLPR